MSSIFSDDALHPGRDPNDSSWQILRRKREWDNAHAQYTNTVYDDGRRVIELAPLGLAPGPGGPACVTAPDGIQYCCDGDTVVRGACGVYATLFGGHGSATGQLDHPSALAFDDRGLLYVADTGNHRVQVVDPEDAAVVNVLGAVDLWGQPLAGTDGGAMTEPVAIAVGAAIYVADRAGQRIHVFDRAFRWVRSFAPGHVTTAGTPIGVAIDADGALVIADATWPLLLRFAPDGTPLADLAYDDPGVPEPLACLAPRRQFAMRGEVIVGPIDGLVEDLAWARVIIDAHIPPGARIAVQTYASDDPATPAPIPWAPAAPVPMRDGDGPFERPVLSDIGRWQRARHGAYRRGNPVIATYAGDGPNGVAFLMLGGDGLARVRAGDVIELDAGQVAEQIKVASVPARTVRLSATGDVHLPFGPGTEVVLIERDGGEPFAGPRTLYMLGAGEAIDLTAVPTDGTLADVTVLHAAAAMWRRGDVIAIGTATILIDDVPATPVAVALAAAPGSDFSTSTAKLLVTPHRLFVDDTAGLDVFVPPDEPISVDGLSAGSAWSKPAEIDWIEPELGAIWLLPTTTLAWADWEDFTTAPSRATDRGRWLWLRLQLTGAAAHPDDLTSSATPTIRSVRLLRPRLSYLRYLPATFSRRDADDPTGALFLERMLGIFERELTSIESRYESVARQLDPYAADPDWLRFLAAWFDLYLDPELPMDRKRLLVAEAHALYAIRGTPEGIRRYIEIVTGDSPTIVEGFQERPGSGLVLGCSGVLGCTGLGGGELDRHAHRFTIFVFVLDPCRRDAVEAAMRLLIESIKPAHTLVDLRVVVPDVRVGASSTVGVDIVLGDDRVLPDVLGQNITLRSS